MVIFRKKKQDLKRQKLGFLLQIIAKTQMKFWGVLKMIDEEQWIVDWCETFNFLRKAEEIFSENKIFRKKLMKKLNRDGS